MGVTTATPSRGLRIAIATLGRFHVLDLARELDALGHDVRFYSYVPRRRACKFGLPAHCHVALLPWLAPLVALGKLMRRMGLGASANTLLHLFADRLVAWKLKPCDVFIGMSGIYLKAPEAARRKYAARIIVERGSVHIDEQKAILSKIRATHADVGRISASDQRRERAAYALADRIVIPSMHVEDSFLRHGIERTRLYRNPYGVDLSMFKCDQGTTVDPKLILFAGTWCYRKGVDTLVAAMATLAPEGFQLYHVGPLEDAPLPKAEWFHHVGKVDQSELAAWYGRARCMVLPSREEGLALVQVQALACGCPVVGSSMSGAADLATMIPDGSLVQVVPVDDSRALADAIRQSPLSRAGAGTFDELATTLSWSSYARRYGNLLESMVRPTADAAGTHPGKAGDDAASS